MISPRKFFVVVALLLALVATACGSSEADAPDASAQAANGTSTDSSGTDGSLVLPTASGGQIAFNDLQGTPTMLWFWAPW